MQSTCSRPPLKIRHLASSPVDVPHNAKVSLSTDQAASRMRSAYRGQLFEPVFPTHPPLSASNAYCQDATLTGAHLVSRTC
eukprot:COSAG02_NODE_3982_length_5955_cov_1.767589_3_plen_81_part_00